MTSSVSAVLLAAFVAPMTAGADAPPGLSARVAGEIAGRWQVPVERIALDWGRLPALASDDGAAIRLAGRGVDGWFVAEVGHGDSAAAVRVRAGVRDTAVVAARALSTGEKLESSDVREEPKVRWGAPRSSSTGRPGPGWEVRRPVAAGEEVAWPSVAPPSVIVAGEAVQLIWMRGTVRVSVTGIAVHAARIGEKVRVRLEGVPEQRVGIAIGPGLATLTRGEQP